MIGALGLDEENCTVLRVTIVRTGVRDPVRKLMRKRADNIHSVVGSLRKEIRERIEQTVSSV